MEEYEMSSEQEQAQWILENILNPIHKFVEEMDKIGFEPTGHGIIDEITEIIYERIGLLLNLHPESDAIFLYLWGDITWKDVLDESNGLLNCSTPFNPL